IVVAIIGIIAAVAIPNLLNALDKSKQKRSMSDLRTISTAVEAYAVDASAYPLGMGSWAALKPIIDPYFIKDPPNADGWSTTWEAGTTANGSTYTITSLGKDAQTSSRGGGITVDFNCDIVFSNGRFFQWPEGTQT
ncbi:MAG: type II secretion system protein GspG, partial [Acidobacteria bacterium]|nr:type II secretion system protein GspG [Acidobacteriota bacterium]